MATAKRTATGVVEHPAWRWAAQHADKVDRMTWMGFATNLVAACNHHPELEEPARREFHRLSQSYATYSKGETDAVFREAAAFVAKGGGPHRWATMSAVPLELQGDAKNLVEDVRRVGFPDANHAATRRSAGPATSMTQHQERGRDGY